jgi:hypothetical protein
MNAYYVPLSDVLISVFPRESAANLFLWSAATRQSCLPAYCLSQIKMRKFETINRTASPATRIST